MLGNQSQQDLNPFFRQWVDRPGAPTLRLHGVRAERYQQGWEIKDELIQNSPYYDLHVPLRLETDHGHKDIAVRLDQPKAPFSIRSGLPPRRLVVDPEVDLFRRLDATEVPPSVNGIRGSKSLLVLASPNLSPEVLEACKVLLTAHGHEEAPILQEETTTLARLKEYDTLYLGTPDRKAALPSLPRGLSLSATGFTLNGLTYQEPGDALFMAVRHSGDTSRISAVFLPLSARAASMAVRKIPHYGRYSYLVYRDGVNRAKGIWPVSRSPLIHVFAREGGTP